MKRFLKNIIRVFRIAFRIHRCYFIKEIKYRDLRGGYLYLEIEINKCKFCNKEKIINSQYVGWNFEENKRTTDLNYIRNRFKMNI